MRLHEMSVWIFVVLAAWLVPLVAYVLERQILRRHLIPLLEKFKRQSTPVKIFSVVFLIAAILYGGTKPARSPSGQTTSLGISSDLMPLDEGVRSSSSGAVLTNASFRITDFMVSSAVRTVVFEVAWATNAFDSADSRGMDVFMSTNLLVRNWFWLNRFVMPTGTNRHAFALGGENVSPDMRVVFTNAFGRMAFFTTGLDVDEDDDALTDAFEDLVVGSSPLLADTDLDGLNDGEEVSRGTDVANSDTDGDGLADGTEVRLGGDPTSDDTDDDGIPDGWEIEHDLGIGNSRDAYHDPDGDGIPNLYEYMNGGDPHVSDAWRVARLVAGDTSVSNGVATLREAFARATPYSVVEVADGIHSGSDWVGLYLPTNQILLTSANDGRSRRAVIRNDSNIAAFFLDDWQTRHTIVQGLRIVLLGGSGLQAGFWCGASTIFQGEAATAVFRNIDIHLLGRTTPQYGWYLQQYQEDETIISGCRVNALGTSSSLARGVWIVQYAPVRVENCTFANFPSNSVGVMCQSAGYGVNASPDGVPVEIENCHFDSSFVHAYALGRVEDSTQYDVTFSNCILPCELDPGHLPDTSFGLVYTNAPLARAGYATADSGLIGLGTTNGYSVVDIDGEPWRETPSIGADEYYAVTNLVADTDGDGLMDRQERHVVFTDPFSADFDFDGFSDREEIDYETDPLDPESHYRRITLSISGSFILPGETNYLFVTTNEQDWVGEVDSVAFTGGCTNVYETTAPRGNLYFKLYRDGNGNGVFDADSEVSRTAMVSARATVVDLDLSLGFIDRDGDSVYDYWEHAHGLSPTNRFDAWVDGDADGLINLHEFWLDSDPCTYDGTNSVLRLFAHSIDSRLSPNATTNDAATLLPKFNPYGAGVYVPNTNFWLRDVDTSCASMWNSEYGSHRAGTAISKRHVIQAQHYYVSVGTELYFHGTDGNIHTNTVTGIRNVGGVDIAVLSLAEDLPDAVSIAQVMPTNFYNYIGTGTGLPTFYFDQEEKAPILEIGSLDMENKWFTYQFNSKRTIRVPYSEEVAGGDSSDPVFFLANNQVVLMAELHQSGHSPFMGFYTDQIQNAMDALCPGCQLRIFDLSHFSEIILERIRK